MCLDLLFSISLLLKKLNLLKESILTQGIFSLSIHIVHFSRDNK